MIESTMFSGKAELIVTGNIKDIMKESVSTAMSWIKSNLQLLNISKMDFTNKSIHLHVPSAATPKDGPSAGVTLTISLVIYNFDFRFHCLKIYV